MTFFWLLLDATGEEAGRSEEFDDQEAAESWLSGRWPDLRGSGVEEVVLHEGDDERYRMSLSDEG